MFARMFRLIPRVWRKSATGLQRRQIVARKKIFKRSSRLISIEGATPATNDSLLTPSHPRRRRRDTMTIVRDFLRRDAGNAVPTATLNRGDELKRARPADGRADGRIFNGRQKGQGRADAFSQRTHRGAHRRTRTRTERLRRCRRGRRSQDTSGSGKWRELFRFRFWSNLGDERAGQLRTMLDSLATGEKPSRQLVSLSDLGPVCLSEWLAGTFVLLSQSHEITRLQHEQSGKTRWLYLRSRESSRAMQPTTASRHRTLCLSAGCPSLGQLQRLARSWHGQVE